jgi:acyl carrier protein
MHLVRTTCAPGRPEAGLAVPAGNDSGGARRVGKAQDIDARTLEVLARIAPDIDPGEIDPAISFRDQFDFDSMDFLNYVVALAREFAIEIPESDYPRLSNLAGCTDYVRARLGADAG